jgi:hypothetical protein
MENMMANWFYYDNFGTKQGPITNEDLKSLVAQGMITPQTNMETDQGQSGLAGQINGLFPLLSAQQPPYNVAEPNYPQQPQYGQQQYSQGSIKPPADYLVWSIISTLCMCLPLGIVGIVMSVQSKSAF